MNPYEVLCATTGDRAEAETRDAIRVAARTLVEDAAQLGCDRRLTRQSLIVTREGRYDGLTTTQVREGRLS